MSALVRSGISLFLISVLAGCGGGDGAASGTELKMAAAAPVADSARIERQVNTGSPRERIVQVKQRACSALAAMLVGAEHEQFMNQCLQNVFRTVVSFGDSISDVGTYKVGTIAAAGGGQWTINGPTALNWTEYIAGQLGAPAPCAAQTGLLPTLPGFVGAAIANHGDCTNYAQGRARVSNAYAPESVALQAPPFYQTNLGLLAVPLTTQMSAHLAKIGGAYSGNELVTVWAAGNDLGVQLFAVSNAAAGGPLAVALAYAAGWPADVQAAVAGGGAAAINAAITAAVSSMGQAGTELAAAIKAQILDKGARFVLVLNHIDLNQFPYAGAFDAQTRALVTALTTTFNTQLEAGLSGTPALLVDAYGFSQQLQANAQAYGFTNATTPACSLTSAANPLNAPGAVSGGINSLACTEASTVAADTSGYLYSDGGHPTPRGYATWGEYVLAQLRTVRWGAS